MCPAKALLYKRPLRSRSGGVSSAEMTSNLAVCNTSSSPAVLLTQEATKNSFYTSKERAKCVHTERAHEGLEGRIQEARI